MPTGLLYGTADHPVKVAYGDNSLILVLESSYDAVELWQGLTSFLTAEGLT